MPFAAALSEHPVPAVAVGAAVGDVVERLGAAPDVAVLFVTPHHVGALEDIAAAVQTLLAPTAFIGATAVAVLVGDRGVEDGPGLALWAGRLAGSVTPGVPPELGLSLFTARRLAELNGGTVQVTNIKPAGGLLTTARIPFAPAVGRGASIRPSLWPSPEPSLV